MHARARRWLRGIGIALACVVGLCLLVIGMLWLPPVRSFVCKRAIAALDGALPGDFRVTRATWQGTARFTFEGVDWSVAGEPLLQVDRVHVDVATGALWKHDLVVEELRVDSVRGNVARLSALFPPDSTEVQPAEKERGDIPFLRNGAIPGLPSVQVRTLAIDVPMLVLGADTLQAFRLDASCDLIAGHVPMLAVDHIAAAIPSRQIELRPGSLHIDLQRATIAAQLEGRLPKLGAFTLASTTPDSATFALDCRLPDRQVNATFAGRWQRDGYKPIGLVWNGEIGSLTLAQIGVPKHVTSGPMRVRLNGTLGFETELQGRCRLDARVEGGPEATSAVLAFGKQRFSVTDLLVHLPGLSLRADVQAREGELAATASVRCDGTGWLVPLLGDSTAAAVQAIHLGVEMSAQGKLREPRVELVAHGSTRYAGFSVDSLHVVGRSAAGTAAPIDVALSVDAIGHRAVLRGRVTLAKEAEPLRAQIEPIHLTSLAAPAHAPAPERAPEARVAFDAATGSLQVEALRITGDLGDVVVNGSFQRDAGADASVQAQWPRPPTVPGLSAAILDSLRASWSVGFVPSLQATASASFQPNGTTAQVDGTLHLPGPWKLRALLPAQIDATGMQALEGTFRAASVGDSVHAEIDLGATTWIDTLVATLHAAGGRMSIDALRARIAGVGLDAALVESANGLDGVVDLSVLATPGAAAPQLLHRWRGLEACSLSCDGTVRIAGTRAAPRIDADIRLAGHDSAWALAQATANARIDPDAGIEVSVLLPQGIELQNRALALDSAMVHYTCIPDTSADWMRTGRLRVDATGELIALMQESQIDLRHGFAVRADSLHLRLGSRDLRNTQPFEVAWDGAASELAIRGVDLAGTLGTLRATCVSLPESLALDLDAELEFPANPASARIPDGAWPTRLALAGSATSHRDVRLSASLAGLHLGDHPDVRVRFDLEPSTSTLSSLRGSIVGTDTLVVTEARLPIRFTQFPHKMSMLADSLHAVAWWKDVPLPNPAAGGVAALFDGRPDAWNPDLSGRATLTGSAAAPDVNLTARIDFPRSGSLSNSHVDVELHGRGDTRTRADVALKQGTATLARLDADAPLRFTFAPAQFGLGEDSLSARAKIDQLNLVELGPLLPAGVTTKGIIATDLRVEGPAKRAAIGGFVRIDKLEAELPGRRYLSLDFASNLGGTLQVPEITGTLRIQQARLRIPERQNLLPTTGTAILWERTGTPDTLATAGTLVAQSGGVRLPFDAKVDMKLDVPSGFWILGKDLGVELSGDLDVGVRERQLIVSGTLEASQGWLTLMGRNFELEQGRCEFDGINTLNPELQIEMQTRIKSTEITVSITGDVEEPDLELTSVPEMSEGNILSMLVFGVTSDELGTGETDFLAAQAVALAQSYSGAALGQVLGDQLGVDMVRFKSTGDEDDTSSTTALEIGKYLTPNILVQYEIDLETGRGRDVTMEYRINDRLTLDSVVSRAARSGLRLTWGEDY